MKKLPVCMVSSEFSPYCGGNGYAVYHLVKTLIERRT